MTAPRANPAPPVRSAATFDGVVVLSPFAWHGPWQTPHYVARQLARHAPVVFAEKPATWSPGDADFALARLLRRGAAAPAPISVVSTRGAPLTRFRALRRWALDVFGTTLSAELERRRIGRPLGWVSYFERCTEHLERAGIGDYVYHCLDAFETPEERELARRAAAVIAVSQRLVDRHAATNPNTFHLPNGIEASAVATQAPQTTGAPSGRVIGFVGILTRHIDFVLLEKIARAFPNDQLVVGGPLLRGASAPNGEQKAASTRLRRLANVRFLGFIEPARVAEVVHTFSVGIIPFVSDAFNAGRDPIKFYHYFAQGKPVVTTSIAVAHANPTLCMVAGTHGDFVAGVGRALSAHDDAAARERIEVARRHTWEALVPRAVSVLEAKGLVLRRAS